MMKMYSPLSVGVWARLGAASVLLLAACAPGQDVPTPSTGINASRYVAVGDNYTAGQSNGGLTHASQDYSFPNQLAQQFNRVNAGAAFTQPYLDGSGSGYLLLVDLPATGLPRVRRVAGQAVLPGGPIISPAACGGPDTLRLLARNATPGTLPQNLGLPGLQLTQIDVAGLGNAANATPGGTFNPYFERLLPAADNRTYLQAVTTASATATFFTYFMGIDTMLPYLRGGGDLSCLPSTALLNFNARKILGALTTGGRQGMIARLPGLPALTNLPLLRLGRGLGLISRLQASFGDTARVYIEDPFNSGPAQVITDDDYVLATALPRLGQRTPVVVNGTTLQLAYGRDIRNPVRNADVLDKTELARLNLVVTNHNADLELAATAYKMPIIVDNKRTLDSNAAFPNITGESILVNGVIYSGEPVRGNFYSLDYYSLTPRGNALLANAFIVAINTAYHASIPAIEINKMPTSVQ